MSWRSMCWIGNSIVKNIPGCTSRTSENNSSSSEIPYWHGLISPHALDAYERKQTSHIPLYIYIEKNRCAIVVLFPIMCTLPFNTRILFPPLPGLNNQLLMLTSWHFRFVFICFVFYSEQRNSLFSDTVFRQHRFVFAFPQFSARHALKKCFVFITDSPPYCWLFSYRDAHRGRARDAEMERSGMRLDGCGWTFRKKRKKQPRLICLPFNPLLRCTDTWAVRTGKVLCFMNLCSGWRHVNVFLFFLLRFHVIFSDNGLISWVAHFAFLHLHHQRGKKGVITGGRNHQPDCRPTGPGITDTHWLISAAASWLVSKCCSVCAKKIIAFLNWKNSNLLHFCVDLLKLLAVIKASHIVKAGFVYPTEKWPDLGNQWLIL